MKNKKISIGDTVKIPFNLTTDPYEKRGQHGKIVLIIDNDFAIEFENGEVGLYDRTIFEN